MRRVWRFWPEIGAGVLSGLVLWGLELSIPLTIAISVFVMLASLGFVWTYERYPKLFGIRGSMATTALIFRDATILLVYHPRQKKWLPPGCHCKGSQKPHEIILLAIEKETGYKAEFHKVHTKTTRTDRFMVEVPQPFYVQEETQLSGEGHEYHYDMFYVCTVHDEEPKSGGRLAHKWTSLGELTTIVQEGWTYPDVERVALRAYTVVK